MRQIFLAALAVVAMASCSKNETTDVAAPKGISFGVVKGNSVETKAAVDADDAATFGVFAFDAAHAAYDGIANSELKKTGQTWGLDKVHFYPENGDNVTFWSYGTYNQAQLSNIACEYNNGPKFTLTLANTHKDVDIWATQAAVTGSKSSSGAIVLAHKRIMAQVKFQAYTTDATNFQSKITSITVKAKGTANYANKVWATPSGTDITWTSLNNSTGEKITATATGTAVPNAVSLNMIPKSQKAVIEIKADIYNADGSVKIASDVTSTITLDGTAYPYWAQGKAYTYVIMITPSKSATAITFGTPTIEEWTAESGGGDIGVPDPTKIVVTADNRVILDNRDMPVDEITTTSKARDTQATNTTETTDNTVADLASAESNKTVSHYFEVAKSDLSVTDKTWLGSLQGCRDLANSDGKGDWRMPVLKELALIYKQKDGIIAKNVSGFTAFGSGNYWSATEYNSTLSWYVNLLTGYTNASDGKADTGNRVRCVRDVTP